MASEQQKEEASEDPVAKRLDALLRLIIETSKPKARENFTVGDAARLLYSAGLAPTEVAKILGKKKASDVSKYLYAKK